MLESDARSVGLPVCLPWCCGVTGARCFALFLCVVSVLRGWAGFHTGLLWISCYVIFMDVVCMESAGVRHHSVVVRRVTVVLPVGSCWWYLGVGVVLCMIDRLGPAVGVTVTEVLVSPGSVALVVLSSLPVRRGRRVGRKLLQQMDLPRLCSSVRLVDVNHPAAVVWSQLSACSAELPRPFPWLRERLTERQRDRERQTDRLSERERVTRSQKPN